MKVFNPNKFKKFFRTFICSCINGICLGFVIWQTIKCMKKFIENPKGTEVSMKKSTNLPFPAITICGLFGRDVNGDDMGLNETYLQNVCGLRYYSVVLIFSLFINCYTLEHLKSVKIAFRYLLTSDTSDETLK